MFWFPDGFNTLNVNLEAWNKSDHFPFSEVFKQPQKFPFIFLICNFLITPTLFHDKFQILVAQ